MHATLTRIHRTAAVKYQGDRILSYSLAASAAFQADSDRVIVMSQESRGWTGPTTALAMILIALSTLVGGGATTWHYWNTESRAAQAAQQAAAHRHADMWRAEMQRVEAARQQHSELVAIRAKTTPSAFATAIPAAQDKPQGSLLVAFAQAP
jgi:hypothetical protein